MNGRRKVLALLIAGVAFAATAAGFAAIFSAWSAPASAESIAGTSPALNSPAFDGCPAIAKNDLALYFASARAGGLGGLDIWVSRRDSEEDPWDEPVNLGSPVNSAAEELCPSPRGNGHGFMFVSTRPGGCGGGDLYATRLHAQRGWAAPENLGCAVNSSADEASPFVVGDEVYFSSRRAGGFAADPAGAVSGDADIYVSTVTDDGNYGAPLLAAGLNTAQQDARPNLRRDGREIFFDSNPPGGVGASDLWSATRASTVGPWTTPANLGPLVNSAAAETRPSLSWDATTLYFGSTRVGSEPTPGGCPLIRPVRDDAGQSDGLRMTFGVDIGAQPTTLQRVEEPPDVSGRAKMADVDGPLFEWREDLEDTKTIGLGVRPDPAQQREVDPLRTPFRQVGP